MNLELWLSNLWFYSLQTGILILVGGLLAWLLRLRAPGTLYFYWRLLMVFCLLLVFQPRAPIPTPDPASIPSVVELVPNTTQSTPIEGYAAASLYPWMGALLVTGILLRLIWLGFGFYRLHRLKRKTAHHSLPEHLQLLEEDMGISAQYRVSAEVAGPVTFGWLRPVIILPESFGQLGEDMQRAVVCHELLHVRRRDWLWNSVDELVRTLFWFHPAYHWLIRRVQMTREHVVDEQAVTLLGSRKTYLSSLLEIAKRASRTYSLPAPLFLEECQLNRRVRLLLQLHEVKSSKTRTALSLASCFVLLAVTGWWSLSALPLSQPPAARPTQFRTVVEEPVPIPVAGNVMANKLLHRDEPEYPLVAKVAGVGGVVVLRVLIDKNGAMQEATVVQGHPALRAAAVESMKNWRWEPAKVDGKAVPARTMVTFNFVLRSGTEAGGLLLRLEASGILRERETALDEERILQRTGNVGNVVVIEPDHDVPGTLILDTVERLKQAGIDRVFVLGTSPMEF